MALIVEFICELPNGVHARPQATLKRCVILFHHKLSGITCAVTVRATPKALLR
ncbi:multiphosphoryl transfer protein 2 [includes phosphoenolpyruvate-protein phosphotransferase);phosphocarrier protein Hpr; fructose-like specific PTS system EIIA component] [Escherichia fergusonii]|nr:multiphosphoryl transfer protein 2 [includes phosphoenolpyruvate-protein phosphotransferase);phosphocarrier protein Hpr; fructose-like specific PTS system EIIA component] [Escherichia fergusonii]